MTAVLFVCAAAAGAVGRHLIAHALCSWQALLIANTAGAALLGWIASSDVADATATVVGVGLCGALTTYSSFALEARRLGARWGSVYVAITLICVCGAASLASTV
jgi:CrcB protein